MTKPLTVMLNETPHTLAADTTLAELLAHAGIVPTAVATAIDGEFVPRVARDKRVLKSGEHVICVQAIEGG
ncbi:MAG: sulfur carrier protein ThiS [Gammaproteobacteria bacterium]